MSSPRVSASCWNQRNLRSLWSPKNFLKRKPYLTSKNLSWFVEQCLRKVGRNFEMRINYFQQIANKHLLSNPERMWFDPGSNFPISGAIFGNPRCFRFHDKIPSTIGFWFPCYFRLKECVTEPLSQSDKKNANKHNRSVQCIGFYWQTPITNIPHEPRVRKGIIANYRWRGMISAPSSWPLQNGRDFCLPGNKIHTS